MTSVTPSAFFSSCEVLGGVVATSAEEDRREAIFKESIASSVPEMLDGWTAVEEESWIEVEDRRRGCERCNDSLNRDQDKSCIYTTQAHDVYDFKDNSLRLIPDDSKIYRCPFSTVAKGCLLEAVTCLSRPNVLLPSVDKFDDTLQHRLSTSRWRLSPFHGICFPWDPSTHCSCSQRRDAHKQHRRGTRQATVAASPWIVDAGSSLMDTVR